jgi:hypothetical protein
MRAQREQAYEILLLIVFDVKGEVGEAVRKAWAHGESLLRVANTDAVARSGPLRKETEVKHCTCE